MQMTDDYKQQRILFIFYLQDDNKHMNYALDEAMLGRYFDIILETNVERTIERHRHGLSVAHLDRTPKANEIAEEVLNDIVFGYCLKLSESLFPIDSRNR